MTLTQAQARERSEAQQTLIDLLLHMNADQMVEAIPAALKNVGIPDDHLEQLGNRIGRIPSERMRGI